MTVYIVVQYVDLGYHVDSIWLDKNRAEAYLESKTKLAGKYAYALIEEEISDLGEPVGDSNTPYLEKNEVVTTWLYNPEYGDDRTCICGHPYYRHFDSYNDNEAIGCKYCDCDVFEELNDAR